MTRAIPLGYSGKSVQSFYAWSVDYPDLFWPLVWESVNIIASTSADTPFRRGDDFADISWFPGARLNIAENLLRYRDEREAIIAYQENGERSSLTYQELFVETGRVASGLAALGIKEGDTVAALMPNIPEAVIFMLAAASLGAIFCSASPDFGASGIIERFGQIAPRILLTVNGYWFKGKAIDITPRVREIAAAIPSIETILVVPNLPQSPDDSSPWIPFSTLGSPSKPTFAQLPFDAPLYVLFSSGTTGKPKCIVHRAGGVLLEHLKEHMIHGDLRRDDTIFYQTTCGWMMWNWLISALAVGSRIVLFDGSPLADNGLLLFRIAEQERITVFGTNAKFLSLLHALNISPKHSCDLSSIRTILSTGSPLLPEQYDFIRDHLSTTAQISSISGGTDIVGCFALGCPDLPVHRGELQMRSLGLAVEVWNNEGKPVVGERGELVCTKPFPTVPLGFWSDSDRRRFSAAYFSRFPGVWHHGDYVELTPSGGMIFYGRSDTVLNPGGVRIGTAEIYREIGRIPWILDSVAVGQRWLGDERIVLFIVISPEHQLTTEAIREIQDTIRKNASPFHVPKKIIAVPDIPRTRSGKVVEIAIKQTIHGEPVQNLESLANPEALVHFIDLIALKTD